MQIVGRRGNYDMRTAVMTDSNSGITKSEAKELGIFSLPMPVIIDGEICYEGDRKSVV